MAVNRGPDFSREIQIFREGDLQPEGLTQVLRRRMGVPYFHYTMLFGFSMIC